VTSDISILQREILVQHFNAAPPDQSNLNKYEYKVGRPWLSRAFLAHALKRKISQRPGDMNRKDHQ